MPKHFTSPSQKIGELGENIAVRFLMKQGFQIIERNYTKKWGEIDIIAKKLDKLHFFEVKSVSRETLDIKDKSKIIKDKGGDYRPEENMHPRKLQRISRTVQTYLISKKVSDETNWQIDLIVVYLNMRDKKAIIKVVKDIIL